MKIFTLLTALIGWTLCISNASAAEDIGHKVVMDNFVEGCRFVTAYAGGDGAHLEKTPDTLQGGANCITAVKPALYIAVAAGKFSVGSVRYCVPPSAEVIDVVKRIVILSVQNPKAFYSLPDPATAVLAAINNLYPCS